jgi:hypothetical protein
MGIDVKIVVIPANDMHPQWRGMVNLKIGDQEVTYKRNAPSRADAVRGCQSAVLRTLAEWVATGDLADLIQSLTFNVVED